jgi:hypothetical protein
MIDLLKSIMMPMVPKTQLDYWIQESRHLEEDLVKTRKQINDLQRQNAGKDARIKDILSLRRNQQREIDFLRKRLEQIKRLAST